MRRIEMHGDAPANYLDSGGVNKKVCAYVTVSEQYSGLILKYFALP